MDSRNPGQPRQSTTLPFSSASPRFRPSRLGLAVVAAIGLMAAQQAEAGGSCSGSRTTISGPISQGCTLGRNQSVTLTQSGAIEVQEGAAVTIQHAAVGTNRVINNGTLKGERGIQVVETLFTGKLQNTATGVIESRGDGIGLSGSTLTGDILNAGQVSTTQAAALSIVNSTVQGSVRNSGTLAAERDNAYGQYGLQIHDSVITGDLRNSGEIFSGSTQVSLRNSTLGGSFINSGNIGGATSPLMIDQLTIKGDFINYGSIHALDDGSSMNRLTLEGRWINQGNISAGITGLAMANSDLRGGMVNAGTLSGGSNTIIRNNTMASFENSGTIDSYTGALDFTGNRITGNFLNSGTIKTNNTGYAAIILSGSTIGGSFVNTGTLYAGRHGGRALLAQGGGVEGDFVNAGVIEGSNGLVLDGFRIGGDLLNHGSVTTGEFNDNEGDNLNLNKVSIEGSFINTGRLEADRDAMFITQTQIGKDWLNTASIRGENGLYLAQSHIHGSVLNQGSVWGQDRGLAIVSSQIDGRLLNEGSVQGGVDSLTVFESTLGGDLVNRGQIMGGSGMAISGSTVRGSFINQGSILSNLSPTGIYHSTIEGRTSNYGVIGSQYNGPYDYSGLSVSGSTLIGEFTNAGEIFGAGTSTALDIRDSTLSARLSNRGTISGESALVIRDSQLNTIVNTGALNGQAQGLRIEGNSSINGGLVNAGLIAGSRYALYVAPESRLSDLYLAGNDTARFAGAVYAPATTATLYSNATYTLQAQDSWTLDTFVNRGTLNLASPSARAASPATLTGDYTQRGGSILRTEVLDQTHYGKLLVSGTATLPSDARIDVDVANASQPFKVQQLADVLSAGTLRSDGTFRVSTNSALFDFAAVKDGNTVDLALAPKSANGISAAVASTGLTQAAGAAQALDSALGQGSASALAPYFVSATSSSEVASATLQTLPLGNASLRASQAALGEISQALQDRLVPASPERLTLAPTASLWAKPFRGQASSASGRSGGSGQVLGLDTRASATQRVGLAFAYAAGDTQDNAWGGSRGSRVDLWQFTGYSAHTLAPATELLLYAGAGRGSATGQRSISLAGASGKARAEYASLAATFGASLGHAYALGSGTRVVPSLRLDYSHLRDEAYRERGGSAVSPLLLSVDARETDQLIIGLDGRLEHHFAEQGGRLQIDLGLGYDLINDPGTVTARFAGAPGQPFETHGSDASPWVTRVGLAWVTPLTASGAELSVNYSTQRRSDYEDSAATVKVAMPF